MSSIKKIARPAISMLLVIALVITGIPWLPGKASAATIDVSIAPPSFESVYGGQTTVAWNFQDSPHTTSLETCEVEPYTPPPPPPGATYDPPTPYTRTSLQQLATVPASGDKQYTYDWKGNDEAGKPLADGSYTVCVVPSGAEQYFNFGYAKIENPAPAKPEHIQVLPDLNGPTHIIRGVAERGTRVHLTLAYTKRVGKDQVPGETVHYDLDVLFDDNGQNNGSHLQWARDFDYSKYFDYKMDPVTGIGSSGFPFRSNNAPAKYVREWQLPVELHPYEIVKITATAERTQSNPYYNANDASKNNSEVSDPVRVERYIAPVWDINWEALAGYYYKALGEKMMVEKAQRIADDNGIPAQVCIDGKSCPGFITKGWNLIFQDNRGSTDQDDLKLAGNISQEEFKDDLTHEKIANRSEFNKPAWWDPINLATGDFSFHHTNMSLQAAMPLDFAVTYHSRDTYDGAIGVGWHHSWEWRLERRDRGIMYVVTPEGAAYPYEPQADGTFLKPAGTYNTLVKQNDGSFMMETPQLWKYRFRQDGMLYTVADANGNTAMLTYEGTMLDKVETDSASMSFAYGPGGKIATLTDQTGRQVKYSYDELRHDLTAIELPDGGTIKFSYDFHHQMIGMTNPEGTATLVNTYDSEGRVIHQRDFYGQEGDIQYVPEQHQTVTTDPLGRVKTFEYNDRFLQTAIHYPDGTVERFGYDSNDNITLKQDRNGKQWQYVYDEKGNLHQAIDPYGHTTTITYNAFNKPETVTDALGQVTTLGYDANGNVIYMTDALGQQSAILRDGRGIPTGIVDPLGEQTKLTNDSNGFVQWLTDPAGFKQHLLRDDLHRVTEIVDPLGQSSKLTYDARDRIQSRIDALGQQESYAYDKDSNLTSYADASGAKTTFTYQFNRVHTVTDALGNQTVYDYDQVGNLVTKTAPNGAVTKYEYNNVNRPEKVIVYDHDEHGTEIQLVTELHYDGNGNMVWRKDPKGSITQIQYDARNLPTQLKDALGHFTTFEYDELSRLIHETDPLGHMTVYMYDKLSRLVTITDALGQKTTFEYDKAGRLTKTVKPNKAVWTMQYDARGLLMGMIDPLGHSTSMQRDALGRVITTKDEAGTETRYGYDKLGRVTTIQDALQQLTSMAYDPMGRVKQITDAKGQTTSYGYDILGRLTSVTNALGASTGYTYDAVGNILSKLDMLGHLTSYRYNARDEMTEQINPLLQSTKLTYEANGQTASVQYPDGKSTSYQYDALKRLAGVAYSDNTSVGYEYDAAGRRTAMREMQGGMVTGSTTYDYDVLNRLTRVTNAANQTIRYEWTPSNQRSKVVYPDGSVVKYGYDAMDRMTSVTDAGGLTTQYTYDVRGLLLSKALPTEGSSKYQYDALGRVLDIRQANQFGKVVEELKYAYDPVGNRTRMERSMDGNDEDDNDDDDHPDSIVTQYAYDAINQLTQVQQYNSGLADSVVTAYSYDAVGNRLSKSSSMDDVVDSEAYTYDATDKLVHLQNGANYKDFSYDLRGNLLKVMGLVDEDENESITSSLSVTPSVYGKSAAMIGSLSATSSVYGTQPQSSSFSDQTNAKPRVLEQYVWNAANRLVQQTNDRGDVSSYAYDGDGNRLLMTADVEAGPDSGSSHGHDNMDGNGNGNGNGNGKCHTVPPGFIPPGLAKKCGQVDEPYPDKHPGGPRDGWEKEYKKKHWEFHYTNDVSLALPEPLQVTDKSQLNGSSDYYKWKQTYTYGAGGERISMNYLPANDPTNGWEPSPGQGGAEPGVAPKSLFYLNDALGSTLGLIDKDGRVSSRYHYDEFGVPLDAKKFDPNWPGPDNLAGYTGLDYGFYDGLNYARARYYKPELGRFISEDTYKGSLWNPQSQNGYAYVQNNPLKYVDLSGHKVLELTDNNGMSDSDYIKLTYLRWKLGDQSAYDNASSRIQEKIWNMAKSDWTIKDALSWSASGLFLGFSAVEASIELAAVGGVKFFLNKNASDKVSLSAEVDTETIITSANKIYSNTETEVGHSLAKHMSRKPDLWGKQKGNTDVLNARANEQLNEILNGEGYFEVVTSKNGVDFLEKKLLDGRGVRLNKDGTFKGFIDQ